MAQNKQKLLEIGPGFWNIRGSFRLMGLDIGTQVSLIRRKNGRFLFLDSFSLDGDVLEQVHALTDGGKAVEAVVNLHPFHTVHVEQMQMLFPKATHYGTARHLSKFPHLKWAATVSEDLEASGLFKEDLAFSVPAGVDFISGNENVHFSSVLAYHPASGTIHVDDTLTYTALPNQLPLVGGKGVLALHPTLAVALEKRESAAAEFREWLENLCAEWEGARNLCAAHNGVIRDELGLPGRIRSTLTLAMPVLTAHRFRHG